VRPWRSGRRSSARSSACFLVWSGLHYGERPGGRALQCFCASGAAGPSQACSACLWPLPSPFLAFAGLGSQEHAPRIFQRFLQLGFGGLYLVFSVGVLVWGWRLGLCCWLLADSLAIAPWTCAGYACIAWVSRLCIAVLHYRIWRIALDPPPGPGLIFSVFGVRGLVAVYRMALPSRWAAPRGWRPEVSTFCGLEACRRWSLWEAFCSFWAVGFSALFPLESWWDIWLCGTSSRLQCRRIVGLVSGISVLFPAWVPAGFGARVGIQRAMVLCVMHSVSCTRVLRDDLKLSCFLRRGMYRHDVQHGV